MPLICCTWWERSSSPVIPSKNATCVRWIVLKINFIFFLCFLFFLNPKNPNDHHHQNPQTPNNLPCLMSDQPPSSITSWSLSFTKSFSLTSIPQKNHLNQCPASPPQSISTFKVQLFFSLSDQPIWQQNSSPNPSPFPSILNLNSSI